MNTQKLLNFFLEITDNKDNDTYYIKNLIQVYPDVLNYMLSNTIPDLSKVKYVKTKRYNQLKEKVLENYNLLQLNEKLNDVFPIQTLKIIIDYYKNKFEFLSSDELNNIIIKRILTDPYKTLCYISGLSFIKVDKLLLEANSNENKLWNFDLKKSVQRCTSFILWYLSTYLYGSTYINLDNLKNIMNYKYLLNDCMSALNESLQDYRITVIDNKVCLTYTYQEEQNIARYIQKALEKENQFDFNININDYRNLNDFNLSDNQIKTLEYINKYQLVLLNGYAGTGKSSSIKALINMLEDNNKTYRILAPTAKAAKQISLYTERKASTIHYLLCREFPDFDKNIVDKTEIEIVSDLSNDFDSNSEFLDYDVLIIDETSMLSISLFNILLKYIDCKRTKVLLIGDSYQLPSIQNGNLYQDLLEINDIPKVTLDKIFRYTENGLITVATDIRLGKRYLNNDNFQKIGDSYEFYQYDDTSKMINAALNKYMDLINSGVNIQDIAILTAKNIGNSGTNLINSCVQTIINPIDEFDDYISIKVDKQTIRFKENDIVMNIKNNYGAIPLGESDKVLIANGQTGKIKYVNSFENSLILEIDNKQFKFEYSDICNLRLAYCFTIHKAQGSQFKYVIYIVTQDDMFMTNSNLMYVAVTRAQQKCFQFGSKNVINLKIYEKENLKRNTTLVSQYNSIN